MSILNIGILGLNAAYSSLSTTSNNISNLNTEGYSRQRTEQSATAASFYGGFYLGTGVNLTGIERVYDSFLSEQVRSYTAQAAQQDTFYSYAGQIDELLGSQELSINTGLNEFFNAIQEVSNDPTSIAARQVALTQAELLAGRFNTLDRKLTQLDQQIDSDIYTSVQDINKLTDGIADLNRAILSAQGQGKGAMPNDLLDKRDNLLNQLSDYVSTTTVVQDDGSINVFVGNGQALVVGTSQVDLNTVSDNSTDPPRMGIAYGPNQINVTAQINGGSLGGSLQFRSDIIDSSRAQLNTLAQSVVTSFNTTHSNGFDLDGIAGGNFFDPAATTARDIKVVLTDPRGLAASSGTDIGPGNNENMLALADLQTDKSLVVVSAGPPPITRSLAEQYSVTLSDVATRTRQAGISYETQQALLLQTKQRFDSVSGVNLDEEAANLIKYQQAYQAASQIINVSNTLFDSLMSSI